MKKVILLSALFSFLFLVMQAQVEKILPIPSFRVAIDSAYVRFQENIHRNSLDVSRAKRIMNVKIISNSLTKLNCQAQVSVYSLDGLDTLGPFTVLCGNTLVVEIDEREWGVLVQTNSSILTDVWIE
jgi:hypothetical protein